MKGDNVQGHFAPFNQYHFRALREAKTSCTNQCVFEIFKYPGVRDRNVQISAQRIICCYVLIIFTYKTPF